MPVIVCVANFFFFFSAQLTAAEAKLKCQEASAGGSNKTPTGPTQIKRPRSKIGNLQKAMGLKNDPGKYHEFCVSVPSY